MTSCLGDIDKVRRFVGVNPDCIHQKDVHGNDALYYAARFGHVLQNPFCDTVTVACNVTECASTRVYFVGPITLFRKKSWSIFCRWAQGTISSGA